MGISVKGHLFEEVKETLHFGRIQQPQWRCSHPGCTVVTLRHPKLLNDSLPVCNATEPQHSMREMGVFRALERRQAYVESQLQKLLDAQADATRDLEAHHAELIDWRTLFESRLQRLVKAHEVLAPETAEGLRERMQDMESRLMAFEGFLGEIIGILEGTAPGLRDLGRRWYSREREE